MPAATTFEKKRIASSSVVDTSTEGKKRWAKNSGAPSSFDYILLTLRPNWL